jgi:hypothetical protein
MSHIVPGNLARSIISFVDGIGWNRHYQLHIDGELIIQPVLDINGQQMTDSKGQLRYSNPKIQQLSIDDSLREFPNFQDKTTLYKVRIIQHENYNKLIDPQRDWELSFDDGETFYPFEVMKIQTSPMEDFSWIVILGN